VLDTTSGSTIRFSWLYRPGATKAHSWYSTTGSASRNAASKVIFSGTRNGEMTLVAIKVAPAGRLATSGAASMSYSWPGPGHSINAPKAMPTAMKVRISRSRSSTRPAS
jgi:hypothetical protein